MRQRSSILGFGTALPAHRLDPEPAAELLTELFPRLRGITLAPVTRYTVEPVEPRGRGLGAAMGAYRRYAPELAAAAAEQALAAAGVRPEEIDAVVSVSCTGYLVPSLDVHLIPRLGLRRDVRRLPLTELGCSGGLAGLALGHEWLHGHADARALVVAVELPSLNLQPNDRSLDNLTASIVFGDGAAAAVLSSAPARPGDLEVTAVASQLLPDSVDALGFDLRDDGFHTVLQPRLAKVVGEQLRRVVDGFWEGAPPAFYAVHAGGARIFDAVREALQLDDAMLEPSRSVWGRTGNLSSASILFVLAELPGSGPGFPRNGAGGAPCGGEAAGDGLAIAFGPGVTVELARLRRAPG